MQKKQVAEAGTAPLDPARFRAAMGAFATGVAVITTRDQERCHGMAVNSLTAVSLDPCLLLFCVKHGSATGQAVKQRGAFAVNLLSGQQRHLVRQFCANPEDRFAGVPMVLSTCGMPLLSGSLAHLCCTVADIHPGGDHDIVVGRVHMLTDNIGDLTGDRVGNPLVFFRGGYGGYTADEAGQRQAAG